MEIAVLLDIDGTMVLEDTEFRKTSLDSFTYGFKEVYHADATVYEIDYNGKTDRRIIREVLEHRGFGNDEINLHLDEMFREVTNYVSVKYAGIDPEGCLIDGAKACLDELSGSGDCILGIVTGNTGGIAKLKLKKLGICDYFEVGAFGDSTEQRSELVESCISQAERKYGISLDRNAVYVVGDTPFDIACAKQSGTISVAVPTGKYSKEQLLKHSPAHIVDNLRELPSLIKSSQFN